MSARYWPAGDLWLWPFDGDVYFACGVGFPMRAVTFTQGWRLVPAAVPCPADLDGRFRGSA